MQKLRIVPLRSTHLPGCAALYAAVFSRPPWNGHWAVATAAQHIRESLNDASFRGLVVMDGTDLIGFAYGVISQWESERRFYLKEMCILTHAQGRGIGRQLLTRLQTTLRREKVRQISLGTGAQTPARKFYEGLGFAVDPETVIMTKRLRRSAASS